MAELLIIGLDWNLKKVILITVVCSYHKITSRYNHIILSSSNLCVPDIHSNCSAHHLLSTTQWQGEGVQLWLLKWWLHILLDVNTPWWHWKEIVSRDQAKATPTLVNSTHCPHCCCLIW